MITDGSEMNVEIVGSANIVNIENAKIISKTRSSKELDLKLEGTCVL